MSQIETHLPTSGKPLDVEASHLRKTYSSEPVIIEGIVGEGSQGIMSARVFGGGYRVHTFIFVAWKIGNGNVSTGEFLLSRAVLSSSFRDNDT